MLRIFALSAALSLTGLATNAAGTPLSAQEFEDYTSGKTVTYANRAGHAGEETYLDGRRVLWADDEGVCSDGTWYQMGEMICFDYGEGTVPQCWWFYLENHGLRAEFVDGSADSTLFETGRDDEPIECRAPGIEL